MKMNKKLPHKRFPPDSVLIFMNFLFPSCWILSFIIFKAKRGNGTVALMLGDLGWHPTPTLTTCASEASLLATVNFSFLIWSIENNHPI